MNKLLMTMLALPLLGAAAHAQVNNNNPPIAEALKDWKTVRIGLYIDGGDYVPPQIFYLLQRMDAERVILSCGEGSLTALPVFRKIVPADLAQKAIDRACASYAQAQKEISEGERIQALPEPERIRALAKYNLGISSVSILLEVCSKGKTFTYMNEFEMEGPTIGAFGKLLDELNEGLK